MRHPARPALPL